MRRFTTLFFTIFIFFATYGQTDIFNISDSNKQINTICAKSSAGLIVNEDTLISQPNTTLNVAPSTNILYCVRSSSCPLTPSGITGPEIVCVSDSFTLTAEGDSLDGTYSWYEGGCGSVNGTFIKFGKSINIQTSTSPTGYNEGIYTFYVLISGPGGCGSTGCASKTVKVVPIPQVQISSSTNVLCNGESTGKATAGAGNGTSPYTFAWSNDQTGATATGLSAGTYSVIATDANGCTNDQGPEEVTITQPSLVLSAGITNNTGSTILTCTRTSISVTATATGGTGSATYKWDNNSTNAPRSLTSAGTYTVTVTDANGCTASKSITITKNITPPTAAITGTSTICPGESTTLTASGGGTYNWSHSLGTGSSKSVSPTTNTTYYVTVTGSNGCTATASKTVTVLPGTPAQPSAITGTTSICPSVGTAYSVTNVTGVTYNWTYSGTGTITGSGNNISLSATTNGTLSVTASNSCGTSTARTQAITILPGTPAQPGVISGTVTQCPGLTGQVYSISAVTNATTYIWIVPVGWTITAGQGSTSITVSIGTAGQNGNIGVTAGNSCGTSSQKTLAVTAVRLKTTRFS